MGKKQLLSVKLRLLTPLNVFSHQQTKTWPERVSLVLKHAPWQTLA